MTNLLDEIQELKSRVERLEQEVIGNTNLIYELMNTIEMLQNDE